MMVLKSETYKHRYTFNMAAELVKEAGIDIPMATSVIGPVFMVTVTTIKRCQEKDLEYIGKQLCNYFDERTGLTHSVTSIVKRKVS